jgi:hypothetical protein
MTRVIGAADSNVVDKEIVYPKESSDGETLWFSIADYLVLAELLNNVVVFNASSPFQVPSLMHSWEILAIGGNKENASGFNYQQLILILENNPNCCR